MKRFLVTAVVLLTLHSLVAAPYLEVDNKYLSNTSWVQIRNIGDENLVIKDIIDQDGYSVSFSLSHRYNTTPFEEDSISHRTVKPSGTAQLYIRIHSNNSDIPKNTYSEEPYYIISNAQNGSVKVTLVNFMPDIKIYTIGLPYQIISKDSVKLDYQIIVKNNSLATVTLFNKYRLKYHGYQKNVILPKDSLILPAALINPRPDSSIYIRFEYEGKYKNWLGTGYVEPEWNNLANRVKPLIEIEGNGVKSIEGMRLHETRTVVFKIKNRSTFPVEVGSGLYYGNRESFLTLKPQEIIEFPIQAFASLYNIEGDQVIDRIEYYIYSKGRGYEACTLKVIAELLQPLTSEDSSKYSIDRGMATFKETIYDTDTFCMGDHLATQYTFEFTNNLDVPISIIDVRSTCGCVCFEYGRDSIKPGEKGFVKMKYDSNRLGPFYKSLSIHLKASHIPLKMNGVYLVFMKGYGHECDK